MGKFFLGKRLGFQIVAFAEQQFKEDIYYLKIMAMCVMPSHWIHSPVAVLKEETNSLVRTYLSAFDFCSGRCRHNSESVVHENAYVSDFHHCFSLPSNSFGSTVSPVEARLNGINVVIGREGESCDSVCKLNGQSCVLNKLLILNQCDIIQKYVSCKGACLASVGADQPAEVVDDAPKHLNPGACLYARTQSVLSCDGSHQHTRRLCPCA
ncbi:hypothetical protein REPUB_Repub20aG0033600 [Reevesia pubescens]